MKTLQILEYGRGLRASKKTVIGCGEDENQIGGEEESWQPTVES
jgi:hypothetical protein